MEQQTRREFLADVGKGMLVASIGTTLATDLGIAPAEAAESGRITFGKLEPLADLMQSTPADKLLPILVTKIKQGTDLRTLTAAGALANARAFGGEDYVGFHSFMALAPAYEMSKELPDSQKALPVLKVLYRSTNQIHAKGVDDHDTLHPVEPSQLPSGQSAFDAIRQAAYRPDPQSAERTLASIKNPKEAFDEILHLVQDDTDVHRTVLAYRAWNLLDLTGKEHAHTTLRQSIRYSAESERHRQRNNHPAPRIRALLPKLIDQYSLLGKTPGSKQGDNSWLEEFSLTLLHATTDQAAEAVAAALKEGFSAESIGEALVMTANHQLLRDPGRTYAQPGKPLGSCHGDSIGVHASDAMNAWRNIAKVSSARNTYASLIVAGYHVVQGNGRLNYRSLQPYPHTEHAESVRSVTTDQLLSKLDDAIRSQEQARAAALAHRAGELKMPSKPIFDLLLKYATSEDGALHAEKFYRTVSEEFARARPAYRWRHLTGLARVTASEYGRRADGYEEARKLLGI